MNRIRKILAASSLAACALAATAVSEARTDLYINLGPPAPIYEAVPPPRHGYVWAPGYWDWNGHRHVWHRGYWVRERPGYRWHGHHWVHRGNHWELQRGYWGRG